ncbi:MAG TPA: peptide chain release factor N(5)-glutamine methyltransferase [Gemmatimonadetes bacterium]|nr:peptide chain release factor N(5)-glutamine methyltransferase [Gemmatimonadota bacterium]|tara:strand:- start:5643 stop:6569 length:927 start_codon:yes stop_codon:yes gene_type:complete
MNDLAKLAELERDSEVGVANTGESWTILRMILWSAEYLKNKGVETGRLDAEWLLAAALGVDRLQLYLKYDRPLSSEEREAFKPLLRRRAGREPLQYIIGRTGFRELELKTDPRVLIPRPETEVLVQEVLDWASAGAESVWDMGTGAGAVALSLAAEGTWTRVVATDVSPEALSVAADNAERYDLGGHVEFREGSLFEPLEEGERFDVIVSNPPYIAEGEKGELQPEVRDWEPPEALFAGEDGLDVIRQLVAGAPKHLLSGGLLALECGLGQAEGIAADVQATGAFGAVRIRADLTGRPRFVTAERGAV